MVDVQSVCVFCGSSTPTDEQYGFAAQTLGELLARKGMVLVYGGGTVGLMGVLADSALALGGRVVGVIPAGVFGREIGHAGLSELHVVPSMHERKRLMYDLADAFVALPGGLGTLEELAEVATWSQLGLHRKPIALLDVDDFWEPLVLQLDRMVSTGLLKPANRALIHRTRSAEEALSTLASALSALSSAFSAPSSALSAPASEKPAYGEKWITGDER